MKTPAHAQDLLGGRGQQVIAPAQRRVEGALAIREVAQPLTGAREGQRQSFEQLDRAGRPQARGRQFDREGKTVDRSADARDRA